MARSDFTESSYDPEEIYTGSQDSHGHSANFRCAVPRPWNGAIQQLVQSPEWPYRTVQEFVRDAIYHRLHWTTVTDRKIDPAVKSVIAIAQVQAKMERMVAERENSESLKEAMRESFGSALRAGDAAEVRHLVDEFQDVIMDEVREPFKSQLLDELSYWAKRAVDL